MRPIHIALVVGLWPAAASGQPLQVVHRFEVPAHAPRGGLVQADDGDLYGTTSMGGDGRGAIYRMAPGGVVQVVQPFTRGSIRPPTSRAARTGSSTARRSPAGRTTAAPSSASIR